MWICLLAPVKIIKAQSLKPRWGCRELENTETTQHALETFKPEGALGGGGCGERQLEEVGGITGHTS